ncbi:glycosyltransferase family 4 protein [Streptomyces sp. NPDC058657]|uniref:glycosyltransferase family 4 protein n=1 Tax=unclassified Streptomyces TaxID=2593676 RepID=UPI00365AB4ED
MRHSPSGKRLLTVLHLVQPVDGGVARVVVDLVRSQVGRGVRALVACPPGGPLARQAAEAGAEVLRWPAGRAPGPALASEVLTAAGLIRRSAPDVLHAHSAKAGLAGRLAVRGRVPTIFQPHAWSFDAMEGRPAGLARTWERQAARWSTRILCVSEAERHAGEAAGIAARWSVIHNGIDLARFSTDTAADGAAGHMPAPGSAAGNPDVRTEARPGVPAFEGPPPGAPLVVCVGRLCRQKGQDVLLRAWPAVTRSVPGARLVLVGEGPEGERLRHLAPPGVLFAGAVTDTRPWLHAADVVVLPSRWEGMALAPLEAMACGTPVVLSDVSGARESLPPGDAAHCLVPPQEPAALASALTALLCDRALRESLGRRARSHARAAHDVRTTAAAVLDLYREVLGSPRPAMRECTQ